MVNAREFIEENLVIRTKDARIVPLRLNPARQTVWTRDMLEDWLHADEEGRRTLVRMWGSPV